MGGIKNRDAKRAAAKVFSSGGGGGTKGPAVVDKRGEELPCPHCERVFKQSGRLKDHIAKQHAEQLQGGDGGDANASSSGASPSTPAPQSTLTTPEQRQQRADAPGTGSAPKPSSQPGSASGLAKATVSATATAAASTLGGSGAVGGPPATTVDVVRPTGGGAPGAKATMDVGARGGYFDEKSPKLLLHEWCAGEKRPRPRFMTQSAPGGLYGCKVVLPDPRGVADRDVVVWLDASLAAPDAEEAAQRGAVAALHAVQGDRALDYVLPARHRVVWRELTNKAAQREAKRAAAAKQAAQKRERQAVRRAAAERRGAVNVVMSEEQRLRIEALIRGLDGTVGVGLDGDDAAGGERPWSDDEDEDADGGSTDNDSKADNMAAEAMRQLVAELDGLGFAKRDAAAAVRAAGRGSGGATLPAALDWLCLSLPEKRLPKAFAPGASSTISVVHTAVGGPSAACAAATATTSDAVTQREAASAALEDPGVTALLAAGYPLDHAMAALERARGSVPAALAVLCAALIARSGSSSEGGGTGTAAGAYAAACGAGTDSRPPAAWAEEREVLIAIFGPEVAYPEPAHAVVSIDWPEAKDRVELHVWCPPAVGSGGTTSYPDVPPAVSVVCARMPPTVRLALTARLAAKASRLAAGGHSAVYDLAVALSDALEQEGTGLLAAQHVPSPYDRLLEAAGTASAGDGERVGSEQRRDSLCQQGQDLKRQQRQQQGQQQRQEGAEQGEVKDQPFMPRGPGPQQRQWRPPLAEAVAAESQRLLQEAERLKSDPSNKVMRVARAALPAASKRAELLAVTAASDIVVISGATGCGKSTQVPQYLLEEAVATGAGGAANIIVTQPRRIAATGLASRVAAERGEELGGVVGYSVRLETRAGARTRLLFCTTGVLLRRLMAEPDLPGVTHLVLDEVHERSCESDLLLLLMRRLLARRTAARGAAAGGHGLGGCGGGVAGSPPKLLLMSATADMELFAGYFRQPVSGATVLAVSCLIIPGFTHPVRELWLEDALAVTGFRVGPGSRWARRKLPRASDAPRAGASSGTAAVAGLAQQPASSGGGNDEPPCGDRQPAKEEGSAIAEGGDGGNSNGGGGAGAGAGTGGTASSEAVAGEYGPDVACTLKFIDPSLINYDLLELVVAHIVARTQREGPAALLQGWRDAPVGALSPPHGRDTEAGAILVFLPGAPEIDRLVRQLQSSPRLAAAAAGASLRVLPLHGGLPAVAQARVFERVGRGVVKVVCATNVAETSITIDDVVVVLDTARVKETGYDAERGLSRLQEGWASQAAMQQRRGRAGRVRPGVCFRLLPRDMWAMLAPQQTPEVLRVPLEQLCLSAKAALEGFAGSGGQERLADMLGGLLTSPTPAACAAAVTRLTSLGALEPESEALTALGRHLTAMPLDARDGKALIYACMLRCAGPVLTIVAGRAHGRPVFVSPPDKRSEAEAARRKLAPAAYAYRSDHLAMIAAFAGWEAARRQCGRRAAAEFASQHFISDQAMDAIAASRINFAGTLVSLGFLPGWYVSEMRATSGSEMRANSGIKPDARHEPGVSSSSSSNYSSSSSVRARGSNGSHADTAAECGLGGVVAAEAYGSMAAMVGGPDEFSTNSRMIKAALCAGFYPSILRVEEPKRYAQVEGGAFRVDAQAQEVKLFERTLGRVFVHPASVCFSAGGYKTGWVLFTEMVQTAKCYARELSMVGHYALLLCATRLEVRHAEGEVVLDGWARLRLRARTAVLFARLHGAVGGVLAAKVDDPCLELAGHPAVEAMLELLARDGT